MMTNEKAVLIKQMENQRFLPITDETLHLYQAYSALIDQHDSDELSYLLFYEGEYFFRIGDLKHSLNHLTRCLQAPKSSGLQYLDALSYNILGLIYGYLGQESISISYLHQALSLSDALHLAWECAISCANLGFTYGLLDLYDTALDYFDQALSYADSSSEHAYNLAVLCHAYRGIFFCRNREYDKALEDSRQIERLRSENPTPFYDAYVLNLNIRLYDVCKDDAALSQNITKLTDLISSDTDFLEISECYFDVCAYLLEKNMGTACAEVLDSIEDYCMQSPLIFLRYTYLNYRVAYSRLFSSEAEHLKLAGQLIDLHARYEDEQKQAKLLLFSLEYVERLRQTKNDSEMYREKSRIDQMTGLLNKYTTRFLVEEDLSVFSPSRQSALILVDLDHFKQINDTLGHLAGDSFICQTASIIQNYFKDNALCGRVGGDEFLVYISDATDRSFVILQAEILRQEIYRQTSERNITITTQASIGIAFSSEYCHNYENLFSAADEALYRAKLEGRNKVVVAEQ